MVIVTSTHTHDAAPTAIRRRGFAVISHPGTEQSTRTEALALHAKVVAEAGAVHGNAGRRSTASGWTVRKQRADRRGAGDLQVDSSPGLRQGHQL